jgi:hypothetical protein
MTFRSVSPLTLLPCLILLSSCTTWSKPGATQADYYQDETICDALAKQGGYYSDYSFAHCMQGKGWEKR